ncbi:hypothetical protein ACFSHP_22805 [Novosphingobium panipatense]
MPRGQERTPFQASSIATPQERVVALLLPVAAFFLSWWQVGRLPNLNISICDILLLVCAVAILTSRGLNGAMFGRMSIAWIMGVILLIGECSSDRWPMASSCAGRSSAGNTPLRSCLSRCC